jgi:hypothetical protein
MAFKNIGSIVFLAPGATATWNYSYGTDMGPQFACADIKFLGHGGGGPNPTPSPIFRAHNQCKQLQRSGNATYFVSITNESAFGGFHNLQGGGLT